MLHFTANRNPLMATISVNGFLKKKGKHFYIANIGIKPLTIKIF